MNDGISNKFHVHSSSGATTVLFCLRAALNQSAFLNLRFGASFVPVGDVTGDRRNFSCFEDFTAAFMWT